METNPLKGGREFEKGRRPHGISPFPSTKAGSTRTRGVAVAAFAILCALCPGCGGEKDADETADVEARLEQMERRLAQVEASETKIALLESQFTRLQKSIEEMNRLVVLMTEVRDEPRPKPSSSAKGVFHTVRRGDSLYIIARQHGTTVGELMRLNNLSRGRLIHPGQRLRVSE